MLRWYGYFKEAVPESPNENFRVRSIVICYYLADDTTEVLEPRIVNSGLWQVENVFDTCCCNEYNSSLPLPHLKMHALLLSVVERGGCSPTVQAC